MLFGLAAPVCPADAGRLARGNRFAWVRGETCARAAPRVTDMTMDVRVRMEELFGGYLGTANASVRGWILPHRATTSAGEDGIGAR